jgi:hypothetical protein
MSETLPGAKVNRFFFGVLDCEFPVLAHAASVVAFSIASSRLRWYPSA